MQDKYTEIVGARVIHETTAAYKFELDTGEFWIPKSQSKWDKDKLYVLAWVAAQRRKAWNTPIPQGTMDEAVALLREALAILRSLKEQQGLE